MKNDLVFEDAFNLMCGDKLGEGIHRTVFECRIRPDLVVKVEKASDNDWRAFANVFEMQFWNENEHRKSVASWLAPCEYMSPDGRILLQKRVKPIFDRSEMPSEVPAFLTDLKLSNFGKLDGRVVCVDYAGAIGTANVRMKKAEWHG